MTMQDPIADMLTRIRNAQAVYKQQVLMPYTKQKQAIANVLKDEGYITGSSMIEDEAGHSQLIIILKYYEERPVIDTLTRASKPSLRKYSSAQDIPKVKGGLGIVIISTSKGVMSGQAAKKLSLGGELLCYVS